MKMNDAVFPFITEFSSLVCCLLEPLLMPIIFSCSGNQGYIAALTCFVFYVQCRRPKSPCDISIDISISSRSGPEAAEFLCAAVASWPALRPVCLALKCLMKEKHLSDVSQGGLSSFALSLMVLAHLRIEHQVLGEQRAIFLS